jgi:transcriptional regulator with XRE-family HTH domain
MTMTDKEMTISKIALGVAIRHMRHDRGLTIEDLAFKAGIHHTHLSRIERGHGNPKWDTLRAIASGLDVSLSTLLYSAAAEEETLAREEERKLTPEEFEQHFGDLPTDGEG